MRMYWYGIITILLVIHIWYLFEEINTGIFSSWPLSRRIKRIITLKNLKNATKSERIAIITVLDKSSSRTAYKTAMDSMECYALQNNYTFIELNGREYKSLCNQKDITFQRHCIVAHILEHRDFEWVLFVDGDIGVVNEERVIQEYIKEDADIIFYERFFNFEVMAGSYLAKKSNFSIDFLRGWANYEFRLPHNFHGRHNGAIHMWLVEMMVPNSPLLPKCWQLWRNTTNFETLTLFTMCCREALKKSTCNRIFIYEKGKGWARDSWLTNSHWNPERDFMFHARKEKYKEPFDPGQQGNFNGPPFWPWFDTLKTPLDLRICKEGMMIWNHRPELLATKKDLEQHLNKTKKSVEHEYREKLEYIE